MRPCPPCYIRVRAILRVCYIRVTPLYPCQDTVGVLGQWKAFEDMKAAGLTKSRLYGRSRALDGRADLDICRFLDF